jgi:transposase-like protein
LIKEYECLKKHCSYCRSLHVKLHGKTKSGVQRFCCNTCHKTFTWQRPDVSRQKEQAWFKLWVTESFSIRQISKISGHSTSKLKRIKNYWLNQSPPVEFNYSQYKYLIFDGTYFHKNGCLVLLMDALTQRVIMNAYVAKESYKTVYPLLIQLNALGLRPQALILDGHRMVIRAIREVWSTVIIQRCLYHIQREGNRWLRAHPKTDAAKELQRLLRSLLKIKDIEQKNLFLYNYAAWVETYRKFVSTLPRSTVAEKDLKRTMALIKNALPNMFHYIDYPNIHSTTNCLESFFSRLKADFRRHRGLSEAHKKSYLQWYCFFKNSNTF